MSMQETNPAPGELSAVNAENPWPGLLSFREADQRWFQGRRAETDELARHIKLESLTVLFALSGIGKSSLLQAGLFPALRKDAIFPVYIRLDYAGSNPDLTGQVFAALAQDALAADITVPKPRGGETLWEYFHHVDADFVARDGSRVLPLLVFDQFEEIFTLGGDATRLSASEAFLTQLADLAEGTVPVAVARRWAATPKEKDNYVESGDYKVLISLREDFLPELIDQRRRIAGIPQKRYRLRQMNGEGALLAVNQAKDLVDESVATQIVRYVAADDTRVGGGRRGVPLKDLEVEPALLSVVCRELNNRRRQKSERKISADLLEDGHKEEVLNDFYERSFVGLPPAARTFVEDKLINSAGRRDNVPEANALASPGMTAGIIEQLVERRLLRREHKLNDVRLELTHDLLTGVVATSGAARRRTEELAEQKRKDEIQKLELKKARAAARKFGFVAAGAVAFALVAGVSYVYARQQTAVATQQTVVAQEQTTKSLVAQEAEKKQAEIAQQQTKIAEENAVKAAQSADDATKQAKNAQAQTLIADQQAKNAQAQTLIAQQQQKAADEQRTRAEAQTKAADEQRLLAEQQTKAADEQRKLALQRQQETEAANKVIATETSQNVANESANQIANNPAKALGLIAHSLSLNPNSGAARSLAFDQLLRGAWGGKSVTPGAPGAEPYVHPALRHPAGVLFAVFSRDGARVATVSKDRIVRLWNWQTGAQITAFPAQDKVVNSVAFSPDGNRLVTSSGDNIARVFDIGQRSQVLALTHGAPVKSAVYSADGRQIVTASQDKTAQIWDAASGAKLATLPHPQTVNYAEFSKDGRFVVTACVDGNARVWNSGNGAPLFAMSHAKEVKSASFSPDGTHIVTASIDTNARIWDVASRAPVFEPMKHNGAVYFAAFSADNLRIATASFDGQARVWDATTGRPISAPMLHQKAVVAANFSPDNRRLVTASDDGTAQVWDVWYEFNDAGDLVKLLEGISKFSAASADLTPLAPGEDARRIAEVKAKASQQPANNFLPWFFAHRQ